VTGRVKLELIRWRRVWRCWPACWFCNGLFR